VITPSLPTLSIALAMMLPIGFVGVGRDGADLGDGLVVSGGLGLFFSSATAATTALSMPRLRSIGFMPAATAFMPSRISACASTVAVVVPSPALSEVLEATSFTICAPMFSNLSASSISLATDTPSLVMVGAPKLFSSTTLRPFGPSVALTALARTFTPRMFAISDEEFCGARASSDRNGAISPGWRRSFALPLLLGGRIRDHDAPGGDLLFFHALDDHAVVQRLQIHNLPRKLLMKNGSGWFVSTRHR
jgi:hypothetical protein